MSKHIGISGLVALCVFAVSASKTSSAYAESPGQYAADTSITAQVKGSILADSQLKFFQVRVSTQNNIVALSGYVETEEQEIEAVRVARLVKGVASVTDNMNLKIVSAE